MTEQNQPSPATDDVEGHLKHRADAERDETDDVEGHIKHR